MKKKSTELLSLIKNAKKILITGHAKPDGDVIGAALALKHIINNKKKIEIILKGYPEYNFLFLKGFEEIKFVNEKQEGLWDLGIFLECPEFKRNGNIFELNQFKKTASIDHHNYPKYFADLNINLPYASSVCEVICKMFPERFLRDKNIAACLLTGIITDTNRFQQSNTTPDALYYASILLKTGVNIEKLVREIYYSYELGFMKLLKCYIERLEIRNSVAFGYILKDEIYKFSIKNFNGEFFVNFPLEFEKVNISALAYEIDKNNIKISLRSLKPYSVIEFAKKLGGGGHKYAAGAV
ncbi:MAG: bifunctional oligoribonuclease/PAP phosphatase NrnA, partial [bacterium]|nr:bifunctional oligoribonuclease/PAP phosphatase NrnA [bacterium]